MFDLTDAEIAVITGLVTAPEAWVEWQPVEDQWPGVAAALVASGWLALWDRPDYLALTLTPWGAERWGVRVTEHWVYSSETVLHGPSRPYRAVRHRVAEEVPCWQSVTVEEGPVKLPRHATEVPLRFPDRLAAPEPDDDVVRDDDGDPVTLFAGGKPGAGVPIQIDRRLGRKGPRRAG